MPGYQRHNFHNMKVGSILFLIISFDPYSWYFIAGYLFATFLCGCDLDTRGDMQNNWGILRYYWGLYSKIFVHGKGKKKSKLIDGVDVKRGPSHWILVGTLTRLLFLIPFIAFAFIYNSVVAFKGIEISYVIYLFQSSFYNYETLYFIGGMVVADGLHIILDKQE